MSYRARKQSFLYLITGGVIPPVEQATIIAALVDIGGGNDANVFIRLPENIGTPPTNGWPVILSYLGDGADNNETTTVTGQAMSSGDNLTWTATGTNTGNNRILCTSVVVKDDGVEIGRGQIGGQITGASLTSGSVNLTNASAAITITSSVSLSGSITVDYIYSTALLEGIGLTMNLGDSFDERAIVVIIQSRLNNSDLTIGYFDEVIKHLWNTYTINPNRINATGLSRGARQLIRAGLVFAITARFQFWIQTVGGTVSATDLGSGYTASGFASISCATSDIGGTYVPSGYTNIGIAIVHGTTDGTLANNIPSICTTWGNVTNLNEYPYTLNLFGVGHTSTVWHTNFYFRKFRTDVAGTAPWDYVDFHLRYSRDIEECGTLFVEQAEKRRNNTELDIIDYREALRKVNQLSAGAVKTALSARLATLKSTLDGAIVWRSIIAHSNGSISPTGSSYNVISNHADSQSTGTLVDDNSYTLTGISWAVGDNPLTSNYQTEITSNRGRCYIGGFPLEVNRVGMRISATACPVGYVGLPTGTYTLRLWHNEGSGSLATEFRLNTTIGAVNRTSYSQYNRMIGYSEWTGLTAADLTTYSIGRNNGDIYITASELIRNA